MKRLFLWSTLALTAWLATGLYIVRGNEQALVRRFGKAEPALVPGGLHIDLPWPLSRIERINVHELRMVSVGIIAAEPFDGAGFLRDAALDRQAEFLTGDKNILNLQVNVNYAVADPHRYLFQARSPEIGLKLLTEAIVTEKIGQSSVDYVHPAGLNELRVLLTQAVREAAGREPWGIAVDDVTIVGVLPPVEVKAAFLDVSNARAERDRVISQEESRAEKLIAASQAGAGQLLERARSERLTRVESARGSADRFVQIIKQFQPAGSPGAPSDPIIRRAAMHRLWTAAMEELLPKLARQVLLDPRQPLDLFLVNPPTRDPAPANPPGGKLP